MSLRILFFLRRIAAIAVLVAIVFSGSANPTFAEDMMGRRNGSYHNEGRSYGPSIGVGVGIGVGIINQMIQEQRARDFESRISRERAAKKKRKNSKPKKDANKGKKKAKDKSVVEAPSAATSTQNAETIAFTPPPFLMVGPLTNCKQCRALWLSIFKYITIIQEDTNKLKAREREVADRQAELERYRTQSRRARTSADRIYYARLAEIRENSIRELVKLNDGLRALVEWEKRILQERLSWYEDCSERHCTKPPVASEPSEPQVSTPTPVTVTPPVVSTPEPELTPPSITTSTPPPTSTGSAPKTPPISEPPISLRPPDDSKICGPDITPLVLKVLRDMKELYDKNPGKQAEACHALIDPKTAGTAWDIGQLGPGGAPFDGNGKMEYDPSTDEWVGKPKKNGDPPNRKKAWFTRYSKMCAVPRQVCGATVEFLGTCQHAQVVNYTQWGMMLALCGGVYPLVGQVLHRVRNQVKYRGTAPTDGQRAMLQIGLSVKKQLDEDTGDGAFKPDIEALKKQLQEDDSAISHSEKECELKCKLTPDQSAELNRDEFRFIWHGLKKSVLPSEKSSPREIFDAGREAGAEIRNGR